MLVTTMSCKAQTTKEAAGDVPKHEILNLPKVDLKDFKKNANGAYIRF